MSKQKSGSKVKSCSFCSKSEEMVKLIVVGKGVGICNECSRKCADIVDGKYDSDEGMPLVDLPKPQDIKKNLDEYVIGQERAKKVLSVAVYNHYKRINTVRKLNDVELQKSNVLLIGPTGVGKTLLAQTLARVIDVPFAIADATTLTEAGYVGEDVESILQRLIIAADDDIERAEKGIVYIDEVDKIAAPAGGKSLKRDVSGEGVQHALLKILEGSVVNVPRQGGGMNKNNNNTDLLQINTGNILFICGGACDGLDKIIRNRTDRKTIGFSAAKTMDNKTETDNILKEVLPQDLINYGLVPEFVGRVPIIATLDHLGMDALLRILTEPRNALVKQYRCLFGIDGVKLDFNQNALKSIAKEALNRKTGARGLRAIMEEKLTDIMFEVPSKKNVSRCLVTGETIGKTGKPVIMTDEKWEKEASA